MTVDVYVAEFLRLSRFSHILVSNERDKARRFLVGPEFGNTRAYHHDS